jgi:glutamate racemase
VNRGAPIGVFDSGVGGLTVLRALTARLPDEETIYLGDTARVPYGTRSAEVVTRYATAAAKHLHARNIKLLVIACNTVSAQALPHLSSLLPIPVVGVIEPGAQTAAARTRGGNIAVLATPGTVASGAYQDVLRRLLPLSGVIARACPLFVPLAEEGWVEGDVPRLVAERYLSDLRRAGVDTAVLGCTHYPLLSKVIAETLGPQVAIVDSAEATAASVEQLLEKHQLSRPKGAPPRHRTLCTDMPDRFRSIAERFLGRPLDSVEPVDLVP